MLVPEVAPACGTDCEGTPLLVDLHAHYPMHLLPEARRNMAEGLRRWARTRVIARGVDVVARFSDYQGKPDTPSVTASLVAAGRVGVLLSVLTTPINELDLTVEYGAPPRDAYFSDLLASIQVVEADASAHSELLTVAHSATELEGLLSRGSSVLIHCVEGGFQLGANEQAVRENVRRLAQMGVAYITPAHLFWRGVATNVPALPFLSGSFYRRAFPQPDEGLSTLGRALVEAAAEAGVLVDITHMSSRAVSDTFDLLDRLDPGRKVPVLASHAACRFGRLEYCLTDETIARVADRGGVIGLTVSAHYMSDGARARLRSYEDSVEVLTRHIDRISEVTGSFDHVGIGSNLDGGFVEPVLPGLEHMGRLDQLQLSLADRYGSANAELICSGNALRLLRSAWGRRGERSDDDERSRSDAATAGPRLDVRVRTEVDDLAPSDLARLSQAIAASVRVDDNRGYRFVAGLKARARPPYGRPELLAWNRAYLLRFERTLRMFDPQAVLPWWDFTSGASHARGIPPAFAQPQVDDETNPLWSVAIDPAADEIGSESASSEDQPVRTFREPGSPDQLPTASEIERLLSLTEFRDFAKELEAIKNRVHSWVGGTNSMVQFSSFDPLYWAYCATVDRIWWLWQRAREDERPPDDLADIVLVPFSLRVSDVWDARALGYDYASPEPPARELTVTIRRGEGTLYSVLADDGGKAVQWVDPQRRGLGVEDVARYIGASPSEATPTVRELQTRGRLLYDTFFRDVIREMFTRALESAAVRDHPLSLRLDVSGAPELIEAPWEFLADDQGFVARSTSITRHAGWPASTATRAPSGLPLRILCAILAPAGETLEGRRAGENLDRVLTDAKSDGTVAVHWLTHPGPSILAEALYEGDFDVLHCVGLEADVPGPFETDSEPPLTLAQLPRFLENFDGPPLVVLWGAERVPPGASALSLVSALGRLGASDIMTMQIGLDGPQTRTFLSVFYGSLSAGVSIGGALDRARRGLTTEYLSDVSWGAPVLTTPDPDRVVIDPSAERKPSLTPTPTPPAVTVAEDVLPDLIVGVAADKDPRRYTVEVAAGEFRHKEDWELSPIATSTIAGISRGTFDRVGVDRVGEVEAGRALFDATPHGFRDAYWSLVDAGQPPESVLIASVEPDFPWELVIPYRGEEARQPLGVECAIGRWLAYDTAPPAGALQVFEGHAFAVGGDLTTVRAEADEVAQLTRGTVYRPATRAAFLDALGSGGALHFSGHVGFNQHGAFLLLSGNETVSPTDLAAALRVTRSNPALIFLNCGASNEFVRAFIQAGAGAVIAPAWIVDDNAAYHAATTFYNGLASQPDRPLAEIVAYLRARAYAGDQTGLAAYRFYGHPHAIAAAPRAAVPATEQVRAATWHALLDLGVADEVHVGETITAALRFSASVLPGSVPLRVPQTALELTAYVEASGLHLAESHIQTITVHEGGVLDQTLEFSLMAVSSGEAQVTVTVDSGGYVAGIRPVRVSAAVMVAAAAHEVELPELADRRLLPGPAPDVVLHATLDETDTREQLRLHLSVPALGLDRAPLDPLDLTAADLAALRAAAVDAGAGAAGLAPSEVLASLRAFGATLTELLMPYDRALYKRYWDLRQLTTGRLPTMLIVSDERSLAPWELVCPSWYDEDAHRLGYEKFLAEEFAVTHWIGGHGLRLAAELPLGPTALVHYRQRPEASVDGWCWALGGDGEVGVDPLGHLALMRRGSPFYGLHVLRFDEQPGAGIITEADRIAQPDTEGDQLLGEERLDFTLRRPLVSLSFVNPAYEERPARDSRLEEGWALPLLHAGASAVVGPRWSVSPEADQLFTRSFHAAVMTGAALGEAVSLARHRLRLAFPDRADWLAYTGFGHPRADPYAVRPSDGFTLFEAIGHPDDAPFLPGVRYAFRASYRAEAPAWYEGPLHSTGAAPDSSELSVLVAPLSGGLAPQAAPLEPAGDDYHCLLELTMPPEETTLPVLVRFQDGERELRTLMLNLDVQSAAS